MNTFRIIMRRFLRLLPFITVLNSYRRFHFELFYPYPDVWSDSGDSPGSPSASHPYLGATDVHATEGSRREPFC